MNLISDIMGKCKRTENGLNAHVVRMSIGDHQEQGDFVVGTAIRNHLSEENSVGARKRRSVIEEEIVVNSEERKLRCRGIGGFGFQTTQKPIMGGFDFVWWLLNSILGDSLVSKSLSTISMGTGSTIRPRISTFSPIKGNMFLTTLRSPNYLSPAIFFNLVGK